MAKTAPQNPSPPDAEEYRSLVVRHQECEARLAELQKKSFLSSREQLERTQIKKQKLKVQAAIQGDSLRVSGKNKDDLQAVIALLRSLDLDVPLTYSNYR